MTRSIAASAPAPPVTALSTVCRVFEARRCTTRSASRGGSSRRSGSAIELGSAGCDTFAGVTDSSPDLYERIAALEAQVAYLFQQTNLAPHGGAAMQPTGMPQEIIDLVRSGNKIEAIKRHRQINGTSLADAKHAIDAIG
jgi:hypothetical protein